MQHGHFYNRNQIKEHVKYKNQRNEHVTDFFLTLWLNREIRSLQPNFRVDES